MNKSELKTGMLVEELRKEYRAIERKIVDLRDNRNTIDSTISCLVDRISEIEKELGI